MKKLKKFQTKDKMILIHNFRNLDTLEKVEKAIDKDILNIFNDVNMVYNNPASKSEFYYSSENINHIIFA